MTFDNILTETRGAVGLITLNRPKALNALSAATVLEINAALAGFEADAAVGAIIITGSDKAFAAGADIREMKDKSYVEASQGDFLRTWDFISTVKKPVIAAVAGFALGGGCELALACDFIIAAETARFGQPEVTLGIMPGAGGSQRLARSIGKAKTMDLVLTGRMMAADEAERCGLVARVVPPEKLLEEALAAAGRIAALSQPVIAAAKRAVNAAYETPLTEGL
ncbi:MAG TPA: enoyl-CoA hydratase-related protein, partial [Aestuariivirga sp.]|nr:enoyl-CoA hydratase-related protein [Aestuariivirga sp.]